MEFIIILPFECNKINPLKVRRVVARELITSLTTLYPEYNFVSLLEHRYSDSDINLRVDIEEYLYKDNIKKIINNFNSLNILVDFIINNKMLIITFTEASDVVGS